MKIDKVNQRKAREYFGIYGNKNLVLHHKDETLRYGNPKRYNEWRPEDLVVMTMAEHNTLHKKGSKLSEKAKQNIARGARRPKTEKWKEAHRKSMIEKGYWKA